MAEDFGKSFNFLQYLHEVAYKWSCHVNLNASRCLYIYTCRKRRGHVSSRNPISNDIHTYSDRNLYLRTSRTCHRPASSRSKCSEPQESTIVQHLEDSLGQVKNRPLSAQRVGVKPWRSSKPQVKLFPSLFL